MEIGYAEDIIWWRILLRRFKNDLVAVLAGKY